MSCWHIQTSQKSQPFFYILRFEESAWNLSGAMIVFVELSGIPGLLEAPQCVCQCRFSCFNHQKSFVPWRPTPTLPVVPGGTRGMPHGSTGFLEKLIHVDTLICWDTCLFILFTVDSHIFICIWLYMYMIIHNDHMWHKWLSLNQCSPHCALRVQVALPSPSLNCSAKSASIHALEVRTPFGLGKA